jgi:RNA polymerase sigma-70 factor (ECF subfamily)
MPDTVEKFNLIPEALLKKVTDGDHGAFKVFYETVYPVAYQYVRCFLSAGEDCREVISEVFYIIWKQRSTLMSLNNIKAWLFIVCRNEVYHFLKQKEKYSYISIDEMPVELQIDATDTGIVDDEMLDIYREAVNKLPERCKLIFLMAKEDHLKYREIAEILAIAEGTVEQQIHTAIRKITDIVKRHYAESRYKM